MWGRGRSGFIIYSTVGSGGRQLCPKPTGVVAHPKAVFKKIRPPEPYKSQAAQPNLFSNLVLGVADPLNLDADPGPPVHFDADPDQTSYFDADLDPSPHQSDEPTTNGIQTLHGSILSLYTSDPDLAFHFKAEPDPASQKLCGSIHPDLLFFLSLITRTFSVSVISWSLNVDYLDRRMYRLVKVRGERYSKFKGVTYLNKYYQAVVSIFMPPMLLKCSVIFESRGPKKADWLQFHQVRAYTQKYQWGRNEHQL